MRRKLRITIEPRYTTHFDWMAERPLWTSHNFTLEQYDYYDRISPDMRLINYAASDDSATARKTVIYIRK